MRRSPLTRRTPLRARAATEFAALRERSRTALVVPDVPPKPRGVISMRLSFAPQPKHEPLRSLPHRMVVASLRCIRCGIGGYSQCCHMNGGGGATKFDDRYSWAMCCTRPGIVGCHMEHEQGGQSATLKALRRRQEANYVLLTYETLREAGLWRVPPLTDEQVAELERWAA